MSVAISVQEYLLKEHIPYDVVVHSPTWDSARSAQAAHVSGDWLAKSVMLEDEDGYVMAVIPASHRLDLLAVRQELNRELGLSTEHTLASLFKDCAPGAIPPLGSAYGIDTVVERMLTRAPEVYLEGGDHCSLVHLKGQEFQRVIASSLQRHISHRLGS
jgi:Ala-tRNA(Pro) deacylase